MNGTRAGYAWAVVGLLWVVALLNYLDRQVIFSLFPLLTQELGLSPTQLGLLGTSFLWVYAFASPFAGFLGDRFGRKRVIVGSLLIWSAITWITGRAEGFMGLLIARGLMGLSEACYMPSALALIAAHHDESTRSKATGLHFSGIYAGIMLGGVGGGWMGAEFGWRAPFLLLGAIGVVYSLVLIPVLKDAPQPPVELEAASPKFRRGVAQLLALPGFLLLLTVFGLKGVADWLVYTWMPAYLYEKFGMGLAAAGFAATFYVQFASIGGILFGGWAADRWSQKSKGGRATVQAIGLACAAPFLFLTGVAGAPAVLLTGLVVFGAGRGMFDCNAMPLLCQIAPDNLRGTGYGVLNLVSTFAGGAIALLGGVLKNTYGLGVLLQAAGALLLLAALLLWHLRAQLVGGSAGSNGPDRNPAARRKT